MVSRLLCPKCKVETSPMQVFGWADFYLCPQCELAFSVESLRTYHLLPPAPVPDSLGGPSPRG